MKSKMKNKVIAFAMSLAMVFTMMPLMTGTVHAATEITVNGIKYILKDDNTAAVASNQNSNQNIDITGKVTIPSTINADGVNYSVTSINDLAFIDCTGMTGIDIPSSVTSIGENAFARCSSLESIHIPSSVTSIGAVTFAGCSSLESIDIPSSVTSIGKYAFADCISLNSIDIPSSVTSIGEFAFAGCSSLKSIDIPSSITSIGEHAFGYCSNLTSISIPCDFNKALFSYSGVMVGESDDTFSVEGTEATGTFEYIHDYSDPNYEWSEDLSTCRAAGVCSKCRKEVAEDAKVSTQEDEIDNWQGSKKLTYLAEFDDPGFEDQVKIELHCSTVLNREVINCILQVPGSGLPKDLYFKAVSVEPGSDRWKELYRQLDDDRHVENAAFFDTYLLSKEKDYPFPMPLYEKVRMLFQIPSGWDSDDMETVIVSDLLDIYFEEEIVTRGGVDYVAFMTDHLGTFAMYDKLKENEHLLTKTDKVEPTCTKAGTEAYWTCTECGKKFADESATKVIDAPVTIPAEGHKWDAGKVTKAATCTEKGEMTFTCTVEGCEATKTEEIKAKGHTEVVDKAVPATCTKTGLTEGKHCSVCNEVLVKQETVPATGHKWDEGKVTKEATETSEGIKTYTCTVCGETKTEAIPKLDPKPEPTPTPTPTPEPKPTPTPKPTPAPVKVSGKLLPKIVAKKNSMTISWNKIKGVAGYDIFFARCNHDKKKIVAKKAKTIKGNKTFKWTKSGLKKGTAYKAYVKAYVMKNGKKSYVRTSPLMHAYTGNGTKKYTNAKSVSVNKTKVTLKKGKTFKIKAKVSKVKKNKKLMPKGHAATLRYMTSNKKIATVSKSGKITAKGKGTCYIYVYTHNGVSKNVKVTVK